MKEREIHGLEVNGPEVLAEVEEAFNLFEKAFSLGDAATLDKMTLNDPATVFIDGRGQLFGHQAIRRERRDNPPPGRSAKVQRMRLAVFGQSTALSVVEYRVPGVAGLVRQSLSWVRTVHGWRVALFHESLLPDEA